MVSYTNYVVGEEVEDQHKLKVSCLQIVGLGKCWRDTLPHARGKGRFVATYLDNNEWEWDNDNTEYKVETREHISLSLKAANAIDQHIQQVLFSSLAPRLRVNLIEHKRYALDAEFRVELHRDEVDAFDVEGTVMVLEVLDA